MIVEFKIENFRSIKDEMIFSMQAAPYLKRFRKSNTFLSKPINLLKSSLLFGPNGSGKTNLFNAIKLMRRYITQNPEHTSNTLKELPYQPFKMDSECRMQPTKFSITLLISDVVYNYEYHYNKKRIVYESLKELKTNDDVTYFIREYDEEKKEYAFEFFRGVQDFKEITRDNMLYLPLLASKNNPAALQILKWFSSNLILIGSDIDDISGYESIVKRLEDESIKKSVLNFLRIADFNIVDIEVRTRVETITEDMKKLLNFIRGMGKTGDEPEEDIEVSEEEVIKDLYTIYKGENNEPVPIHVDSFESRGTKKMLLMATILVDALTNEGKTILIDEFDNAFHLAVSTFLLKVINSEEVNLYSQFILNTHELSLLKNNILRVDQIWFAEKDKSNKTEFYSLYDFNDTHNRARNDVSYATDYMNGKYGAWPIVNEDAMNNILEEVRR